MRILAVSDAPSRALEGQADADHWRQAGIELIVSCGDLSVEYLDYLADALRVPLCYVRGNHDGRWSRPPGGEDIDGRLVEFGRVRFLGIEGGPWYNGEQPQLSERAMAWRLTTLRPRLWLDGRVDVVVAHAAPRFCPLAYKLCPKPVGVGLACPYRTSASESPPEVCNDASDHAHRGFVSFRSLILRHRPRLFLHGHRHRTYGLGRREAAIGDTRVVDACGHVVLDV